MINYLLFYKRIAKKKTRYYAAIATFVQFNFFWNWDEINFSIIKLLNKVRGGDLELQ